MLCQKWNLGETLLYNSQHNYSPLVNFFHSASNTTTHSKLVHYLTMPGFVRNVLFAKYNEPLIEKLWFPVNVWCIILQRPCFKIAALLKILWPRKPFYTLKLLSSSRWQFQNVTCILWCPLFPHGKGYQSVRTKCDIWWQLCMAYEHHGNSLLVLEGGRLLVPGCSTPK